MNELQEASNSVLNQLKFISDNTKSNILEFNKKSIQNNPFNSLTFTWQLAQFRKQLITWITLPLVIQEEFWNTWSNVYNPKGKE